MIISSSSTTTTIENNDNSNVNHHQRKRQQHLGFRNSFGYNRDSLAIKADILIYIATMQNKNYATLMDIATNCAISHKQLKNCLAGLATSELITMDAPPTTRWNGRNKPHKSITVVINITSKGLAFLDKVKVLHNEFLPILKDCYMIKSGKISL